MRTTTGPGGVAHAMRAAHGFLLTARLYLDLILLAGAVCRTR
ncbi:hypothetical protein A8924_4800 [Saccharopolyspora erythraea NRRL 2338]|nr:hypothetical protein [Saccharopolyspora erythraea]PFG97365.1 hypothetical protein A8924_4800 [Saccharopolyspora erythraea NRRL 2338]